MKPSRRVLSNSSESGDSASECPVSPVTGSCVINLNRPSGATAQPNSSPSKRRVVVYLSELIISACEKNGAA